MCLIHLQNTHESQQWSMVDVKYIRHLKRFIPLQELKTLHLKHKSSNGESLTPLRHVVLFRCTCALWPLFAQDEVVETFACRKRVSALPPDISTSFSFRLRACAPACTVSINIYNFICYSKRGQESHNVWSLCYKELLRELS